MNLIHLAGIFLAMTIAFSVGASAGLFGSLEERSLFIVAEMQQNFSIPETEKIAVSLASVGNGAADARKYPVKGMIIRLDEAELGNISDDELAGLLAHELAHMETYSRMNWLFLAVYALHYEFSSSFKKAVERETDMTVIYNGFGRELGAFREYRLRTASDADRKIIERYYLSPEEIKTLAGVLT